MKKIIITIPSFGATWTLKNMNDFRIGAEVTGSGRTLNTVTRKYQETQRLPYYEICENIQKHGWNLSRTEFEGPFAYHRDQWVSFDDPISVEKKSQFVKDHTLAGIMLIDTNLDDYQGICDQKYPLLNAINGVFGQWSFDDMMSFTTETTTKSSTVTVSGGHNVALESKISSAVTVAIVLITLLFVTVIIIGVCFIVVTKRTKKNLTKEQFSKRENLRNNTVRRYDADFEERYVSEAKTSDDYDSIHVQENVPEGEYMEMKSLY